MNVFVGLTFESNTHGITAFLIMREGCPNLTHTPDLMQVRQGMPIHKRAHEMDGWWCAIGSHEHTAVPVVYGLVLTVACD